MIPCTSLHTGHLLAFVKAVSMQSLQKTWLHFKVRALNAVSRQIPHSVSEPASPEEESVKSRK